MVKEAEVKLPVESEPKTEPELSIPEVPATGSDKSVSEMVPPALASSTGVVSLNQVAKHSKRSGLIFRYQRIGVDSS